MERITNVERLIKKVKSETMVNYCGWCGAKLPDYDKWKSVLCKSCTEGNLSEIKRK